MPIPRPSSATVAPAFPADASALRPWVVYLRVATAEQRASLAAQEAQCRAMLKTLGLPVREVITDEGPSGATLRASPGLRRILALMEARLIGGLAVSCLDRLTRHAATLCHLMDHMTATETGLLSVSGTSMPDVLQAGLFSPEQRHLIHDRLRLGIRQLRHAPEHSPTNRPPSLAH